MSKSSANNIIVPEAFSSILKTYAKGTRQWCKCVFKSYVVIVMSVEWALIFQFYKYFSIDALRTQPYDLLTWSAAYFRCIANNIRPPVKSRFEENTPQMIHTRSLTKEYLKVLIKQVIIIVVLFAAHNFYSF